MSIQVGFNYKVNPDSDFIVNCKSAKQVLFKVQDTSIRIFAYSQRLEGELAPHERKLLMQQEAMANANAGGNSERPYK